MAAMHLALADEALQRDYGITAGEAFRRAAIYYHTGQSGYYEDPEEKYRIQQLQQAAYRKALPRLQPPGRELPIPFEGITLQAVLRLPPNVKEPPCVILNAGGDSTKEEFSTLEEEFLKRGLATLSYDGPGQSTTWKKMKLRPDFEKAVAAVIDELVRQEEIDPDRIGIWGRSFGGYSAPRAASFDARLKACISIGGFFDMAETWPNFPAAAQEILCFAFGAASVEQAREMAAAYTLKGILQNLRCPFLVVHSGMDDVCPVEASERMQREAKGKATLKVFPEGNHVCDNIAYKVRPLMADWMAEQLSRSSRPIPSPREPTSRTRFS
jgi:2,6-dihydroxypseudooxynicotine hydrolase